MEAGAYRQQRGKARAAGLSARRRTTAPPAPHIFSPQFEPGRSLVRLIHVIRGNDHWGQGDIMNKLARIATAAAIAVAASLVVTQASANPLAWLGLGYTPTDNGNQARADLRRQTVNYPT